VDPILLQDSQFRALHDAFGPKVDLSVTWWKPPYAHKGAFGVLLFDGWYLTEPLVQVAKRRHKDWISTFKKNRNLETASFVLKDAAGSRSSWPAPIFGRQQTRPAYPAERVSPGDRGVHHLLVFHLHRPYPHAGQKCAW